MNLSQNQSKTAAQSDNGKCTKKRTRWSEFSIVYSSFAALRIILTLLPQTGYIHPDEFFQSVEVLIGDKFEVEVSKPWEFNSTFPIRGMIVPYLTVGEPLRLLRGLDYYMQLHFNIKLLSAYTLLTFPRLIMCAATFLLDYYIFVICRLSRINYQTRMLALATSYVILVYGTRTFSNTTEMVLFASLLYLVAKSMIISEQSFATKDYYRMLYHLSKTPSDKARYQRRLNKVPGHTLMYIWQIAAICVFGCFNRPTFALFACPPVFFWLHRGICYRSVIKFRHLHCRMFCFIVCGAFFTVVAVVFDSFYYGYVSMTELWTLQLSFENFVVTPLNFLKYNSDPRNLAKHGLHPRFLHALINIPLLFNIVGVMALAQTVVMMYRFLKGDFLRLPRINSVEGLMTASFVFPLGCLSFFPHQEARFIIPLMFPLVYLYGLSTFREAPGNVIAEPKSVFNNKQSDKIYYNRIRIWLYLNALFTFIFGFLHQGGIYPLLNHMSKQYQVKPPAEAWHLFTTHMYSLPISLVTGSKRHSFKRTFEHPAASSWIWLHEMGSTPLEKVLESAQKSLLTRNTHFKNLKYKAFLVAPITLEYQMNSLQHSHKNLTWTKIKSFYPHLSVEALPDLVEYYWYENQDSSLVNLVKYIIKSLGLNLYQIQIL